jgi:hypothetical protein
LKPERLGTTALIVFYLAREDLLLHNPNESRSLDEIRNLVQTDVDDAADAGARGDGGGSSFDPSLETRTQTRLDNLFQKMCAVIVKYVARVKRSIFPKLNYLGR